jgi:hypothetical protein
MNRNLTAGLLAVLLLAAATDASAQRAGRATGTATGGSALGVRAGTSGVGIGIGIGTGALFGWPAATGPHLYRGTGDAARGAGRAYLHARTPWGWSHAAPVGRPLGDVLRYGGATIIVAPAVERVYAPRVIIVESVPAPLPVVVELPPPPAAACARITVLRTDHRGYWRILRLPVSGAASREELEAMIASRVAEGVAFRLRDATGTEVEIPAAGELDRVLVLPCG